VDQSQRLKAEVERARAASGDRPISNQPESGVRELSLSHQKLVLHPPKPPLRRAIYGWALGAYLDVFKNDINIPTSIVAMRISRWLMAEQGPQSKCFVFAAMLAGGTDDKNIAELASEIDSWATPDDVTEIFSALCDMSRVSIGDAK
jgi:hypothetical protein